MTSFKISDQVWIYLDALDMTNMLHLVGRPKAATAGEVTGQDSG